MVQEIICRYFVSTKINLNNTLKIYFDFLCFLAMLYRENIFISHLSEFIIIIIADSNTFCKRIISAIRDKFPPINQPPSVTS